MALSAVTTNPVAFRNLPPSPPTLNAASTPQAAGRTHHHHGAGKGGNLLSASNTQSALSTATNGSLLDTLI